MGSGRTLDTKKSILENGIRTVNPRLIRRLLIYHAGSGLQNRIGIHDGHYS